MCNRYAAHEGSTLLVHVTHAIVSESSFQDDTPSILLTPPRICRSDILVWKNSARTCSSMYFHDNWIALLLKSIENWFFDIAKMVLIVQALFSEIFCCSAHFVFALIERFPKLPTQIALKFGETWKSIIFSLLWESKERRIIFSFLFHWRCQLKSFGLLYQRLTEITAYHANSVPKINQITCIIGFRFTFVVPFLFGFCFLLRKWIFSLDFLPTMKLIYISATDVSDACLYRTKFDFRTHTHLLNGNGFFNDVCVCALVGSLVGKW